MSTSIRSHAEKLIDGRWVSVPYWKPFRSQDYQVFSWLSGVRNYSAITPISHLRGIPGDFSKPITPYMANDKAHSATWLSVRELLSFNYDSLIEDRKAVTQMSFNSWNHASLAPVGEGEMTSLRQFLGKCYFEELELMQSIGVERIVIWFEG